MKTIALRFGEAFAPLCGTIKAHEEVIKKYGYVWYGKLGTPVSKKVTEDIMKEQVPQILLIQSGKAKRYWAFIEKIQRDIPPLDEIPEYYRRNSQKFKTWFKVRSFVEANKDVMSQCIVVSSKAQLSEVSKYSLSPYFIIEYVQEEK